MEEMEQLRKDVSVIGDKVNKMYYALLGNELSKDGGLVKRIEKLETSVDHIENRMDRMEKDSIKMKLYQKILWSSLGGVTMAIFSYVIQLLIFKK